MKHWNLSLEDPGNYIIAADARLDATSYTDDHIWELTFAQGDPPTLSIQTTFGLRARNFRIFPRFVEGDTSIIDPTHFSQKPTVQQFYPNYLKVVFSPFEGIDVTMEYFVPSSTILKGRIQVANSRLTSRKIKVQIAAILTADDDGHRMAPENIDSVNILKGRTGNIYPVIFITGGADLTVGPYPALSVETELAPGGKRNLIWVQSSNDNPTISFENSKAAGSYPWDSEIAKLEVINQRLIEITTGNEDWDSAFAFSQKCALNLLIGPTNHLPNISCVSSRLPDSGYSSIGDGSDYDHLWSGQTPLEVYHLSNILLPSHPDIVKGLLLNFLASQTQNGFIDFKPGLAGQRQKILATPILVNLTWRIFQITNDTGLLESVFPQLLDYILAWFDTQQDRDGDGIPEWTRPIQSGFEDHPVFSQSNINSQGGDISKVESPSLSAFLYKEIQILIDIAIITHHLESIPALESLSDNLRSAVETAWDEKVATYRNWDRESHFSPRYERIGEIKGPGILHVDREFTTPVRLSVRIKLEEEIPNRLNIFFHGYAPNGNSRIERISADDIRWQIKDGYCSGEQIYSALDTVEVSGLLPEDLTLVEVMDFSSIDHTLFLPLWARIPEKTRARKIIERTLRDSNQFWKTYGITSCPTQKNDNNTPCNFVHMIWNHYIGEGLLEYGYRNEAAELVSNLMTSLIHNLKIKKSFYNFYHSCNGGGYGERNALGGLFSIRLFLDTLGVQIESPTKVKLSGKNPFPWSVRIKYQGLTILRETHRTRITFPGGQSAIVKNNEPRVITLEKTE